MIDFYKNYTGYGKRKRKPNSVPNIKNKQMNHPYKSEAHLQSLCVKWHNKTYPEQWEDLILIFNNPPDARMGGILKAMGLKKGSSDLLYFSPIGKMVWIEMKLPGENQTKEQERFQERVRRYGCDYYVADSEILFQKIIKLYNNGRE